MDPIWVVLLLIIAGFLAFIVISAYRFMRLPSSNPIAFLKHAQSKRVESRKRIALIGDSITHGTASANYVNIVDARLNPDPAMKCVDTINAGINGEFAYNVLQRLNPILQCKPNVITILIGTNDAYGSLTPKRQRHEQRKWKLPESPDTVTYRRYLTAIVTELKAKSDALIALLGIPTIGEDPMTEEFTQSLKYAQIVKDIANATGVAYLPLNETMVAFLNEHASHQKYAFKWYLFTIVKSILAHAFGKSWEKEGQANGFQLHTDHLHLSPKGGAMVAELITHFYLDTVK